jgi:hypothetical protein
MSRHYSDRKDITRVFCLLLVLGISLTCLGAQLRRSMLPVPYQASEGSTQAATVVGEIVSVTREGRTATIKTEEGKLVVLDIGNETRCTKLQEGATTMAGALPVQCGDIEVGDRALVRGSTEDDQRVLRAQRLVVLSRADIKRRRESEIDEWRRRGISGLVQEVSPQTRQITLQVRRRGAGSLIITALEKCVFRRYAPGSGKFADSRVSSFDEISVGDQAWVLGNQSTEGNALTAEQIVSGSFQTLGCIVTEVVLPDNEIKVTTIDKKRLVTISITKNSALRRISVEAGNAIATAVIAGRAAQKESPLVQGPNPTDAVHTQKDNRATRRPETDASDIQRIIDRLPIISLTDIKVGETLAVTGTLGQDKSHLAAIRIVSGADAVLNALKPKSGKQLSVAISAGLPTGVFDFSVGLPD